MVTFKETLGIGLVILGVAVLLYIIHGMGEEIGNQRQLEEIKNRVIENYDFYEDCYSAEDLEYIIFGNNIKTNRYGNNN